MSEKIIRIKSGNEEFTMSVTEEEYRNYYRPWWQMKKKEQRNREAMEQNGYTEESYEEWKENDMRTELFSESMEELAEKRMLLGVLQDAMDSLLPEERELAMKVFGEEMSVYEYARVTGGNRRTLDFRKNKELRNIQNSFISIGFQLHWIRENNMYKVLDYKNVYEYAEKEYGIKKTTCCNFISIIDTFADRDEDGNVIESIADCYRNYSSSQLVAMLGMPEELKQQVTPDMTVKAINKLRKGGEEKPAVKPVAPPATVPAEKPVMKEPVREPAMKEPDAPVKGPDAVAKDAKVAAAGMPEPEGKMPPKEEAPGPEPEGEEQSKKEVPEPEGKAQSKEEVPRPEPEDKAQSKGEAPRPEPEAAAGMENAVPESVRDAAEITGAVTEKESEKKPEPNHAAGTKEPPEDTPANTVGTLMEIDSYALYQSIADKIDAMMRQVFSTNRRMKVRIVCEQG